MVFISEVHFLWKRKPTEENLNDQKYNPSQIFLLWNLIPEIAWIRSGLTTKAKEERMRKFGGFNPKKSE